MQRRDTEISLGGVRFRLKYEAENMFALSRIAGEPWLKYIQRASPIEGESPDDAGMRCADISYTLPLIMAGLAHYDEFARLTDRELRRRLCKLIDSEAANRGESIIVVLAEVFTGVMGLITETIAPPGASDEPGAADGAAKKKPRAVRPGPKKARQMPS